MILEKSVGIVELEPEALGISVQEGATGLHLRMKTERMGLIYRSVGGTVGGCPLRVYP